MFCLGLGTLLRAEWSSRSIAAPWRWPMLALASALLASAVFVFVDYREFYRLYWREDQRSACSDAPTPEIRALVGGAAADIGLFRVHADHLLGLSEPVDKEDLPRKIADTERPLAVSPQPAVSVRRIALAILDDDPEAARLHLRRIFMYFSSHAEMMADALRRFADHRPDEFAALGKILDEELARQPQPRW